MNADPSRLPGKNLLMPPAHNSLAVFAVIFAAACGCTVSQSTKLSWLKSKSDNTEISDQKPQQAPRQSPVKLVAAETLAGDIDDAIDHAAQIEAAEEIQRPLPTVDMRPRDANTQPTGFQPITEMEMLSQAFACSPVLRSLGARILENPTGVTTVYDRAITASDPFFGPQAALAEFDSVIGGGVNAQKNDRVFNNAIEGGGVQELTQDLINMNGTWQRRSQYGGIWSIDDITLYDNNNRFGNRFPNYWEKQFQAGLRQPLLRGAGKRFNTIAGPNARPGFNFSNGIVIANLNTQVAGSDFEIGVQDFVRDLYVAYWNLARQYQNYYSLLAARDLSYKTWQSVLAKNKAKLAGGEANKEAQARAKYYRYCREVQVALGGDSGREGLYGAERRLRQMIGLPLVDAALLRPVEYATDARVVFDYEATVSRALAQRTELRRQSLLVRRQRLQLFAAKNFLLPQLDLIGRYRMRGFGDDLAGGQGRFSSAYRDMFSWEHQEMELGMEMGVTVGRRRARAAVRNATWKLAREQAILREQQRTVEHQVSDAIADVASSYYALQSSLAQVQASRQRLESSQALYEADKLMIEFLLDAQEELAQVEVQLGADQTRYAISLVRVHHAAGQLLQESGVCISECNSDVNVADDQKATVLDVLQSASSLDVPQSGTPMHPDA